jgi:hypothetical protein
MNFSRPPAVTFTPAPEVPGAKRRNRFSGLTLISFGETAIIAKFPLFLSKKRGGVNTGGNRDGANFVWEALLDRCGRRRL